MVGEKLCNTGNLPFEDMVYLESPKGKEKNIYTSKLENNNNYAPLLIGLSWWGMLALTIALFAFTQIDRFYLVFFIVAFVITFPIIIAFTLVDKKSLSEENFVTILRMSFAKIPGLKWLNK